MVEGIRLEVPNRFGEEAGADKEKDVDASAAGVEEEDGSAAEFVDSSFRRFFFSFLLDFLDLLFDDVPPSLMYPSSLV